MAIGTIALLVVVFGAHFELAALSPAYKSAPPNFGSVLVTVTGPNDTIECTGGKDLGAPKYSVDIVANYDPFAGGMQSVDLDLGAIAAAGLTTTLDIALSSLPPDRDVDGNTDTLVSVVLRVKGLNPAGKVESSQDNPFSAAVACTAATATSA